MKLILLACFTGLIGLSAAQQTCPPAEVLSPCVCDEWDRMIECSNIQGHFDLKGIFDNATVFVRDGFTFNTLRIAETDLVEIEAGAVEYLRFSEVQIAGNPQLKLISPRAFKVGRSDIGWLKVLDNPAMEDGGNLWEFVSSLTNLRDVTLSGKGITSMPANALQNLPLLGVLRLNGNGLSHIGSQAFSGAPTLSLLYLENNSLPSEGLPEDAFQGISPNALVSMRSNEGMEFLEEKSYKALLDQAAIVIVGDTATAQSFHCDERVDWICENESSYRAKLLAYKCKTGTGDGDEYIWDYCARRDLSV